MVLNDFKQMQELLKNISGVKRLAVAHAVDEHTLEAVIEAKKKKLVHPILIGDTGMMDKVLQELGENPDEYEKIDTATPAESAQKAVELVRQYTQRRCSDKGFAQSGRFKRNRH